MLTEQVEVNHIIEIAFDDRRNKKLRDPDVRLEYVTSKIIEEDQPLVSIHDSFKKIIVVKDNIMLKRDENGITTMGLKEFILNKDSLDL